MSIRIFSSFVADSDGIFIFLVVVSNFALGRQIRKWLVNFSNVKEKGSGWCNICCHIKTTKLSVKKYQLKFLN